MAFHSGINHYMVGEHIIHDTKGLWTFYEHYFIYLCEQLKIIYLATLIFKGLQYLELS